MIVPLLARVLSRVLRLASLAICLITFAWVVLFAVEQATKASAHQQALVNGVIPLTGEAPQPAAPVQHSGLRGTLDEVFSELSSPFSGVTAGSTSQWRIHIVDGVLALLIYGLGLSFVARLLRFAA